MGKILGIFQSFIGKQEIDGGEGSPSWQKLWFQVASFAAYIVPTIIFEMRVITAETWVDFYKFIIPATIGLYAAGKLFDKPNGVLSWKRIWFVVANLTAYLVPAVFFLQDYFGVKYTFTGANLLSLWQVIVPFTLGGYGLGKYADKKNSLSEPELK